MRIFYKCLTAVLLALVTGFTASAIRVDIDHPEAVTVKIFNNNTSTTTTLSDLSSGINNLPYDYSGMITIKEVSPWVIDSATGPAGDLETYTGYGPFRGCKKYDFAANSDDLITIRTSNPEAPEEGPSFTINVDNPEALVVERSITWQNWESYQLTQNETSIPWKVDGEDNDYMQMRFKAAEGWSIKTISAHNDDGDFVPEADADGWYAYYGGQNYTFTITTEQAGAAGPSFTINVDNPEALVVERSITWQNWESYQLTQNETSIPWKVDGEDNDYMQMRFKAAEGWSIKTISAHNDYEGDFEAVADAEGWYAYYGGQNYTFTITTEQVSSGPTYLTLTLNNPGSVQIVGSYLDEESTEIAPNFVDGQCKIETTMPGMLMLSPNTGWNIVSAEGFQDNGLGGLGLMFQPGDTNTYAIVTEESQSTFITLTVENPSSVNVEVMREMTPPVPVAAQGNEYKIDTANAGTLLVKATESWYISSINGNEGAPAMTKQENGAYSLDFTAGATSTYYVNAIQPTTFTLNIDNPEAVKAEVYYNNELSETLTFTETVNTFPITGWGNVTVIPNESWKIDTCVGDPKQATAGDVEGTYYVFIDPNGNQSLTLTTSSVAVVEPTYITLNVDHPEAITAKVVYGENPAVNLTAIDGVYKVETTEGGTVQIKAVSPWTIVSAEGFSPYFGGNYNLEFTAGAEGEYSITTHNSESGGSTNITVNVDHPEAVTVEVLYNGESERTVVEPEGNVYTIDTTTTNGWIYVIPVDPWNIVDRGGMSEYYKDSRQAYAPFNKGATNTYNITTDYTDAPAKTYITLNVDNPEALVYVSVEYEDEEGNAIGDPLEPTIVQGDNKFETTNGGRLTIVANPEWDITSYDGLQSMPNMFNATYGTIFAAGDETVFTITSVKKSEATHLTLDIDNIDGVTVQVAYTDGDATEIELQQGGTEIDTTKGGDILITAKQNWVISSAIGFSEFPGANNKYMMHFEAGETETYTINVTSVSASVDSILGDEVIETAVFNLQGIKVADSTDNLAAGMYIIAGKKVVVK